MTRRLYYTDAYARAFTSTVADRSVDGTRIYLEETAFYPTSGGQLHDLGTLAGIDVVDVVDEDDRIAHLLAAPLDERVTSVDGAVNWTRRFDHMQQHTGQHLLSAVFEDLFGYKTMSVHFGPDYSTLDLDTESVTRSQRIDAEARANAIVAEARPVQVTCEDAAKATGLRKASERSGTLRIVSIDGIDRSACGGTHLHTTSEIGALLVRSTERVRKSTRIEFVCGGRAIARARREFEALQSIAASLSTAPDDAAPAIAAQAERLKESDAVRKRLEKELSVYQARARYDAAQPGENGTRTIVMRDAASIDELRALAQALLALPRVVLVGALADPPSVLIGASEDSGVDAGRVLKELLAEQGGRGGGSPRVAQGSVPAEKLELLVQRFINR